MSFNKATTSRGVLAFAIEVKPTMSLKSKQPLTPHDYIKQGT